MVSDYDLIPPRLCSNSSVLFLNPRDFQPNIKFQHDFIKMRNLLPSLYLCQQLNYEVLQLKTSLTLA